MVEQGKKKTAVIFAAYATDEHGVSVFIKILGRLQRDFRDAQLFVGINPCSKQSELLQHLEASGLSFQYAITPDELVIDSDVSAFQTALRLLRGESERFDLVWFVHTKSSTKPVQEPNTDRLLQDLFGNRELVEKAFSHHRIGVYGLEIVIHPFVIQDAISPYKEYPFTQLMLMYLFTFYVIRGSIVQQFVQTCEDAFFSEKIRGDRWFFERDFYQIAFMSGYLPFYLHTPQLDFNNWDKVVCNSTSVRETIEKWLQDNRGALSRLHR